MVALAGGGMNPITLILKNAVWATMWLILLVKVQKPGTLTLANLIAGLFGLFMMGSSMLSLPAVMLACALAEALMLALSGFVSRLWVAAAGIAVSELLAKGVSLGIALLSMREQTMLVIPVAVIISVGYLGILAGLAGGVRMVKELKRAGLIRNR